MQHQHIQDNPDQTLTLTPSSCCQRWHMLPTTVLQFAIEQLGARRLIVRGDSELVVRQMTGQYRASSEKLMPLYQSAQQLAKRCSSFHIEHVYRCARATQI